MNELINNDIFQTIVALATIISLPVTIMISILQNKKCSPCYSKITKCILNKDEKNRFEKLSIKYNDEYISQISITTFVFWNKGKKRLKKEDYGFNAPYIEINGKILDYNERCVFDSNFFNPNFKKIDENRVQFEFDNEIAMNQGFVIDIIHTGENNEDVTLNMKLNEIKIQRVFPSHKKIGLFDGLAKILLWIGAISIMLLFSIMSLYTHQLKLLLCFSILVVLSFLGLKSNITEIFMPYKDIPKKFRDYFIEIDN